MTNLCTPTKSNASNDTFGQNLYQIPQCTICLQQLNEDFGSLNCGHIFHINCITQNFQYRGVCPNCQKRSCAKQIRFLHFPLVKNTKTTIQLRKLLDNLNLSEKKQVQQLLKQMRTLGQTNQRLKGQKVEYENQAKNQATKISNLLDQLHKKKNQTELLKKQNLALISNVNALSNQINSLQKSNIYLRLENDKHQKNSKNYEQYHKIKKLMNDHSIEIVKYKQQLQAKNTPPQEICKMFFDMYCMKNLQGLKMKEKIQEFPQKISQYEIQNKKLKESLQNVRRQLRQNNEKKVIERRRYQDLKIKYKNLAQKAKSKGLNDIPDMEDSQTFANIKNPHIPTIGIFTQKNLSIQNAVRKPMINQTGSSTIGGFLTKKKDDKLKMFG